MIHHPHQSSGFLNELSLVPGSRGTSGTVERIASVVQNVHRSSGSCTPAGHASRGHDRTLVALNFASNCQIVFLYCLESGLSPKT